jgi:L-rhamnose isomerase
LKDINLLNSNMKIKKQALLVNTILKPTTIKQALASSNALEWQLAIDSEIKSLIQNQLWRITPFSYGHKPITSKWIFKVKYNVDGSINNTRYVW